MSGHGQQDQQDEDETKTKPIASHYDGEEWWAIAAAAAARRHSDPERKMVAQIRWASKAP